MLKQCRQTAMKSWVLFLACIVAVVFFWANPSSPQRLGKSARIVMGRLRTQGTAQSISWAYLKQLRSMHQFLSPAVAVEPDQRFLDVLAGTRVNLLIQYFQVGDEDGLIDASLATCLQLNLNNRFISRVHLVMEGALSIDFSMFDNADKLVLIPSHRRWTIKDFMYYANETIHNEVVVLSNADLFFDDTLQLVATLWDNGTAARHSYMLSRRRTLQFNEDGGHFCGLFFTCVVSRLKDENNRDQCERYLGSHDAFIFVSPVLHLHAPASPRQEKCIKDDDGHVFENADVTLGTRGVENYIIWTFQCMLGVPVSNPCLLINAFHLHTGSRDRILQEATRINKKNGTWAKNAVVWPTDQVLHHPYVGRPPRFHPVKEGPEKLDAIAGSAASLPPPLPAAKAQPS